MKNLFSCTLILLGYLFPLTFLHVLISWYFKIDINYLTFIGFIACICFIILNASELSGLTRNKVWHPLFIFLLVIPLVITFFTFELNALKYAAQGSYIALIVSSYIITRNITYLKVLKTLIMAAVLLNVILAMANLIYPGFFYYLSYSLQNTADIGDRASGLFLQPNTMGLSLVLIYLICAFLFKGRTCGPLAVIIFLGIFITGSRTAILAFFLVLILRIFSSRNFLICLLKYYLPSAVAAYIIFNIASDSIFSQVITHKDNNFYARVEKIFKSDVYDYQTDGSIRARTAYQQVYISAILHRPIAGHGFKTQQDFLAEGKIWGSAHNIFLELLYLGGIIYLISFILLFSRLYRYAKSYHNKSRDFYSATVQTLMFLLFTAFFSTTILDNRLLYISFGMILSIPNLINISEKIEQSTAHN